MNGEVGRLCRKADTHVTTQEDLIPSLIHNGHDHYRIGPRMREVVQPGRGGTGLSPGFLRPGEQR